MFDESVTMCVVAIFPKQTKRLRGDLSFPNPSSKNLTLGKRTSSVDTRIGKLLVWSFAACLTMEEIHQLR